MQKRIELTGLTFGRLTVLAYAGLSAAPNARPKWLCRCACGNEVIVRANTLRSGGAKSCGCYRNERSRETKFKDITGLVFGRLTVVSYAGLSSGKHPTAQWLCRCSCGNTKIVRRSNLKCKSTQSCGCFQKEQTHKAHFKDLTGKTFERLRVLKLDPEWEAQKTPRSNARWLCLCDCGKQATVFSGHLLSGMTRSCGCLVIDSDKLRCGPLSSRWKKEISLQDRLSSKKQRQNLQNVAARKRVFSRDHYTCRVCGAKRKFQVHHIKAWSRFKEDRYRMLNLITLCKKCHTEFHNLYGTKNHTAHQFFEWWKHKKETQQNGKEHDTPQSGTFGA